MSTEERLLEPDTKELVTRAAGHDLRAFEELVRRFSDVAVAYACAILRDYHAAEDAAQEAFLTAWRNLEDLREPSAFEGWFRRIVASQCSRQKRQRRLSTVTLEFASERASGAVSPAAAMEVKETHEQVLRALADLSPMRREAVMLHYYGERSQKEIAALLQVPLTTIQKRLHDARGQLKERMTPMLMEGSADKARFTRRVLEGVEAIRLSSSVLGTVPPMLRAAGKDLSLARTAGVLGHAFTFSMREGSGECYWEGNIDWQLFFGKLGNLGYTFDIFGAIQNCPRYPALSEADLRAAKDNTWACVRASIDRGVPAMAWSPLTVEQKANGVGYQDWGLLAGYNEAARTYLVRHPYADGTEWEVPFDGFGYTDRVNWYCVVVPREPASVGPLAISMDSLREGVAFARGTRFPKESCCYPTAAEGLAAYEFWREDVRSGKADVNYAPGHANLLMTLRTYAADYLGELVREMEESWREPLTLAAESYQAEIQVAGKLRETCVAARARGGFSAAQQRETALLIDEVLTHDRRAIETLESALAAAG